MKDIFVSYASEDRGKIRPLVEALEARGWTVWWDRTILAGRDWEREIEEALDAARCVVVAWSETSVQKDWVRAEATAAHEVRKMVPVLLDAVRMPLKFRHIQAANLVDWRGEFASPEFGVLVRSVEDKLGIATPAAKVAQPVIEALAPSTVRVNPKDGLPYVWIPPNPEAKIERGFWIGRTPVTQAAYRRVMETNPSHFQGDDLPVESVSWIDAKAYCDKIGMRLPTEAEWEYAARVGCAEEWYGEIDKIAWYRGNSDHKTHPVGKKEPNAWGLYDTLGNVWEWCEDLLPDKSRPVRGASWGNIPESVRVSYRVRYGPTFRSSNIGFRCVGDLG